MRTLGYMRVKYLRQKIFKRILVLYILYLAIRLTVSTGVGSIFWSFRTPPGKKRKVKQESDWKKYYGSCPELKEDIKKYGKEFFSREIISLHKTKGQCNYEETKQLFLNNVLIESLDSGTPAYYNSNILSRYFRKDYFNETSNQENM
jgi:flagellar basal body-associated protein FliL